MMESLEIAAVKSFISAINQGDVSQIANWIAEDHTFVDSLGKVVSGRDQMIEGWRGYFRMFPDYVIEAQDIFQEGNMVAVFGRACGTYNGKRGMVEENRIEMPAAWKAVVEQGKIKLWQVYADWSEGVAIIEEDKRGEGQ